VARRRAPDARWAGAPAVLAADGVESAAQGFDEYMNLVLDQADELNIKTKTRKAIGACPGAMWFSGPVLTAPPVLCICEGRILLKGDNITLIRNVVV
jgi:small nuclear ribonucleoprotein (snRNP)-like protein